MTTEILSEHAARPRTDRDGVVDLVCVAPEPPVAPDPPDATASGHLGAAALRNVRLMHFLERVASRFNEAGVPLMALKGAVLNLTVYERPDERPMADIDLLVRPEDLDRAQELLEKLDGLRSPDQFREDFFPRFYFEVQYTCGTTLPVTIDLHARPFRPLRLSRFMPDGAFWDAAVSLPIGRATILAPSFEHMLVHLAAHGAIHGDPLPKWREDVRRWATVHANDIDWDRLQVDVAEWRLAHPVSTGLRAAEDGGSELCPPDVSRRLDAMHVNWRDRLALWQAPRDEKHKFAQVFVNVLTTPGIRFNLEYLASILFPDRKFLDAWAARYGYRWPTVAAAARWLGPIGRRLMGFRRRASAIKVRKSPIHGHGVFARRDLSAGATIARYRGRPIDRDGVYVSTHTDAAGQEVRHEITGPLRFLNHCCRPKAELRQFRLVALRPIRAGEEITIDYGEDECDCRRAASAAGEETKS